MTDKAFPQHIPPQHQDRQPGRESSMVPQPTKSRPDNGCRRLEGKKAIITGGDSGIGAAVAIAFAQEGADVAIVYFDEHEDARATRKEVEAAGQKCLLLAGDVANASFCREAVKQTVERFGSVDILVNNAAEQHPQGDIRDISEEQLRRTFETNLFSYFYFAQAALDHLQAGGAIINTTSVTAYKGNPVLIDYSSTKGAIVALTRSLALSLVKKGIRVNAVAPGPVWTPLIPASFPEDSVEDFGTNVPMGRVGQPVEIAPSFVFLASDDSAYMSGQVLHPNGGRVING